MAITRLLLAHRDVDVDREDYGGRTSLVVAVNTNCRDIVKLLLEHSPPAFVNHTRVSGEPEHIALRKMCY